MLVMQEPEFIVDQKQVVVKTNLLLNKLKDKVGGDEDQLKEFR